jgi:hypothetical protein
MAQSYEVRVELIAAKAKQIAMDHANGRGWLDDFIRDMRDLKKQVDLALQEAENDHGRRSGER